MVGQLAIVLGHVATCWVLKIKVVCMPEGTIVAQNWPNDHHLVPHPQILCEEFDHFQILAKNTQNVAAFCHAQGLKLAVVQSSETSTDDQIAHWTTIIQVPSLLKMWTVAKDLKIYNLGPRFLYKKWNCKIASPFVTIRTWTFVNSGILFCILPLRSNDPYS